MADRSPSSHTGRLLRVRREMFGTMVTKRPLILWIVGLMCSRAPPSVGFTSPRYSGKQSLVSEAQRSRRSVHPRVRRLKFVVSFLCLYISVCPGVLLIRSTRMYNLQDSRLVYGAPKALKYFRNITTVQYCYCPQVQLPDHCTCSTKIYMGV